MKKIIIALLMMVVVVSCYGQNNVMDYANEPSPVAGDYLYLIKGGTTDRNTSKLQFQQNLLDSLAIHHAAILLNEAAIALKLNISDTAVMLTPYSLLAEVALTADTAAMLANYALLSEVVLPADTATMLGPYIIRGDTAVMLSTYSLLSEVILPADTAAMLAPYDARIDINSTQIQDSLGITIISSYGAGVLESASANVIAFRAAIAAAGDGGAFLPDGKYLINDTLLYENSTNLFGAGWSDEVREGQTTIQTIVNKPIFHVYADNGAGAYGSEYGGTIKEIQLIGSDDADSTKQDAIVFNGSMDFKLERVYISGMGRHALNFGTKWHTHNIIIDNCKMQQNKGDGAYGRPTAAIQLNAITFRDCRVSGNRNGFNIYGTSILFDNNIVENNDSTGFLFSGADLGEVSSSSQGVTVVNNHTETNGGGEIVVEVYWDGGTVFQQHINMFIGNNYHLSNSTAIDKPGIDDLVTLKFRSGSTANYMMDGFRLLNRAYVYNDLGILDAGNTLGLNTVVEMPFWNVAGLYSNLDGASQVEGPTKIIDGVPMPSADYNSNIGVGGPSFAMLQPVIRLALGSPINVTANPQMPDGYNGQVVIWVGVDDTNTFTLEDGNGMSLSGGTWVGGQDDILAVMYQEWRDLWVEQYRSTPYWEDITVTGTITNAALQAQLDSKSSPRLDFNAQTGTSYTFQVSDAPTDAIMTVTMTNAAAIDLIIPTNASQAIGIGSVINVINLGAGTITVDDSNVTLTSPGSLLDIATGESASFIKLGTDTWYLTGGLS